MNKEDTIIKNRIIGDGRVDLFFDSFHYYFRISGTIVEGNKIGRTIGFPTANIKVNPSFQIPKNGVYAVFVEHLGALFLGMLNIGTRPTFNLNQVSVEVHIFDFSKDIYYHPISVFFVQRLRDEMKFLSKELLVVQLKKDEQNSRSILKSAPFPKLD